MQRTLVALGCAVTLALAGGSALAQQQQQSSQGTNHNSGESLTEKAKEAARAVSEKTKEMAEKVKDKTESASRDSGGTTADSSQAWRMQRDADADYKAAKAQCGTIQERAQKNLCEKQATAAHARAEVEVARAEVAASKKSQAQASHTATMGAGKSQKQ